MCALPYSVLIADSDPWTCALLSQLVHHARPDAQVQCVQDGPGALQAFAQLRPQLLITDKELPGHDDFELLRQVRASRIGAKITVLLLSRQADALSVRQARRFAVAAYVAKPFNAERLRQRLSTLLGATAELEAKQRPESAPEPLDLYLQRVRESSSTAPLLVDVGEAVAACLRGEQQDLSELRKRLSRDPQIVAYLIAAANGASLRQGMACHSLSDALPRLGLARTLNLLLGLALERNSRLTDERLNSYAQAVGRDALQAAELASYLGSQVQAEVECCYTAALLHNIGELALLRSLQNWLDSGGVLDEADIKQLLRQQAAGFGSALRIRWRLPLGLREPIAGFYSLNSGSLSREVLLLNVCGELLRRAPRAEALANLAELRSVRLLRLSNAQLDQLLQFRLAQCAGSEVLEGSELAECV